MNPRKTKGATKPKSEDEIRDYLAKNLHLVEPNLTLIDKEKLLPNNQGAKGFVDLFARTATGQLMVIEIKRSDAAARQCLHELSKYAALLRQNLLVKDHEFRLVVLSTDWHELLIPFAEFLAATRYNCDGYIIVLDKYGLPARIEPVELPEIASPRRISGRHFIWEFSAEGAATKAIPIIAKHMRSVGLRDFVLLKLHVLLQEGGGYWLVYFAQQRLTFDQYMALINRRFSDGALEEFNLWLEGITELEDKTEEAADKVWESTGSVDSLYKKVKPDGVQISHPEKARYWFHPDRLKKVEVTRFGRFVDPLLADELIISELVGSGGESDSHVDIKASAKSKPELDALLAASNNALFFNPVWRGAVGDLCRYAERNNALSLHLKIFSNEDILRTLAGLAIGYVQYTPIFTLEIGFGDSTEQFVGTVQWNGKTGNFKKLIKKHFDGDDFGYQTARHFGANRGMNAEIMHDLGLEYVFGRVDKEKYSDVRVQGSTITKFKRTGYKRIEQFIPKNAKFVDELIGSLLSHEMEFGELYDKQRFLAAEREISGRQDDRVYDAEWLGSLDKCDVCGRPFATANFMIDGAVSKGGPWGCLCAACFLSQNGELGWGKGQLYKRTPEGWQLVAGGRPADSEDE